MFSISSKIIVIFKPRQQNIIAHIADYSNKKPIHYFEGFIEPETVRNKDELKMFNNYELENEIREEADEILASFHNKLKSPPPIGAIKPAAPIFCKL